MLVRTLGSSDTGKGMSLRSRMGEVGNGDCIAVGDAASTYDLGTAEGFETVGFID